MAGPSTATSSAGSKTGPKRKSDENLAEKEKQTNPGAINETQEAAEKVSVLTIWPEWSDSDIAGEKWNTKGNFDDPDLNELALMLPGTPVEWKRPADWIPEGLSPCVTSMSAKDVYLTASGVEKSSRLSSPRTGSHRKNSINHQHEQQEHPVTNDDHAGVHEKHNVPLVIDTESSIQGSSGTQMPLDASQSIQEPESFIVPEAIKYSKFARINGSMLEFPLLEAILTIFCLNIEQDFRTDHALPNPWDCIYPKGKDGHPIYNASGKYAVKLFWLGTWRKIYVDDRIPLDAQGKPLLIVSPVPNELWPILVTKALLKLAMSSCTCKDIRQDIDFNVLFASKGWHPQVLKASEMNQERIEGLISHARSIFRPLSAPSEQMPPTPSTGAAKRESTNALDSIPSKQQHQQPAHQTGLPPPGAIPVVSLYVKEKCDKYPYRIYIIKQVVDDEIFIVPLLHSRRTDDGDLVDLTRKIKTENFLNEVSYFKKAVVYHDPSAYKYSKVIKPPSEAARNDQIVTPVIVCTLYFANKDVADNSKQATLRISIQGIVRHNDKEPLKTMTTVHLEEYDWRKPKSFHTDSFNLSTLNCAISSFVVPEGVRAYRFVVESGNTPWVLSFYSDDEFFVEDETKFLQDRVGVHVKDFDEPPINVGIHEWNVLNRLSFGVKHDVFMSIQLYTSEVLDTCLGLIAFDETTRKQLPTAFHRLVPQLYTKNTVSALFYNEKGYTVYIESRTKFITIPVKYKIRVITEPLFDNAIELMGPTLSSKMTMQEFDDASHVPRQTTQLFKYVATAKDADVHCFFQLKFHNQATHIKMEILEDDRLISYEVGVGTLNLPRVTFHPEKRYTVRGSIDEFDMLLIENATTDQPGWSVDKDKVNVTAKLPNKKTSTVIQLKTGMNWKLKVITKDSNSLIIAKDTEKEEKLKQLKKEWDEKEPGRSQKAKDIRDAYLKQVDAGTVKPTYIKTPQGQLIKPWTVFDGQGQIIKNTLNRGILDKFDPRKGNVPETGFELDKDYTLCPGEFPTSKGPSVLTPEEQQAKRHEREVKMQESEQILQRIQEFRDRMSDRSKRMNEYFAAKWDEITRAYEKAKEEDFAVREEYRQVVIKKIEEENARRAAEEAARAALEEASNAARKSAKAKK